MQKKKEKSKQIWQDVTEVITFVTVMFHSIILETVFENTTSEITSLLQTVCYVFIS